MSPWVANCPSAVGVSFCANTSIGLIESKKPAPANCIIFLTISSSRRVSQSLAHVVIIGNSQGQYPVVIPAVSRNKLIPIFGRNNRAVKMTDEEDKNECIAKNIILTILPQTKVNICEQAWRKRMLKISTGE